MKVRFAMKKRWRYIEKDFHKVFKKKCNEMRLHLPLWLINIISRPFLLGFILQKIFALCVQKKRSVI